MGAGRHRPPTGASVGSSYRPDPEGIETKGGAMSAQGATLRRGTAHLPIWPVAALVTAAAATLIGMTLIDGVRPQGIVTSVSQVERLANSSAAIREQGALLPVVWGTSHVTPSQTTFVGLENPG